jgi:hypothetical protein
LAGMQITDIDDITRRGDARMLAYLLWRVRRSHSRYWNALKPSPWDGSNPEPTILERLRETVARIMDYLRS